MKHTNVWANGVLIATDDVNKTHYYLNDWLGTRRVQTDAKLSHNHEEFKTPRMRPAAKAGLRLFIEADLPAMRQLLCGQSGTDLRERIFRVAASRSEKPQVNATNRER